jgi:hypothetical protein
MLMYYGLYVTQMLRVTCSTWTTRSVSRLIAGLRPLLQAVPPPPAQEAPLFPKQQPRRIGLLDELFAKHPDLKEVLIDATGQEIQNRRLEPDLKVATRASGTP